MIFKSSSTRQRGLTLIEIILVLGLLGVMVTLFAPKAFQNKQRAGDTLRGIRVLSKKLMQQARIDKTVYRIGIEIDTLPDGKTQHRYWVEQASATGNPLLEFISSKQREEREEKQKELEDKQQPGALIVPIGFELAAAYTPAPITLPEQLFFSEVQTSSMEKPISAGRAYIHYFPQGLVEQAVIQFKTERDIKWTLITRPLTGDMDLTQSWVGLEDLRK